MFFHRFIKFFLIISLVVISSCESEKASKITLLPKTHNFGSVKFGESARVDFTFTNKLKDDVTLNLIEISGANSGQFTIIIGGGSNIVVGGTSRTHQISVEFNPTGGNPSADLTVEYTTADLKTKSVVSKIYGSCILSPLFAVDAGTPPEHDFGDILFGQTADHTFTITNNGNAEMTIRNMLLNSPDFKISSGWLPNNPVKVQGNYQTHQVTIEFDPLSKGVKYGKLSIYHSATNVVSPYEIELFAESNERLISHSVTGNPPTINFGKLWISKSSDEIFTITNQGTDLLTISDFQISNNTFSVISGWNGSSVSISPTQQHIFTIRYAPSSAGVFNGTVSISHDANNVTTPLEIMLTGQGVDNYVASTFTKGMIALASPTYLNLYDDDFTGSSFGRYANPISMNFAFEFYGRNYTEIYICSNGMVGFGPTTFDYDWFESSSMPNRFAPNNIISIFGTDLNPPGGGKIGYKLIGTAPNRIFVVEYADIRDIGGGAPRYTGQIRLFETSNKIEIHYPASGLVWGANAFIGIENIDGTKGVNFDGVHPNPVTSAPTHNIRYDY